MNLSDKQESHAKVTLHGFPRLSNIR
ncbi:hypothetical protein V12B01_12610 [Vibrio splendidus 12B01]|nr:hypothetical protein V12B01_12610 [Vibrio splendidus 12B01]